VTIRKLGRLRPPHSALTSQRRTSIARGWRRHDLRPPFIRTRERVSNFFGPWRSPRLSQRCCATSAWLFDFCNRLSMRRTGTVPVGQILARRRGLPLVRCHTRLRLRAATFPLCGGQVAPSAAASHVHLSDARSCDRTLSAEHGDPLPRELGGSDMRETWAGGPRDLGRSTLMDCRPSVHRGGLASGAFQLELQPSISCHRRRERAGMDPVRSYFASRGSRRVTSPRRAAAYVHRDAFHHLEPTHGRDRSLTGESAEAPSYATRVGRCRTKHSRCFELRARARS
jgi:hypothetical protein